MRADLLSCGPQNPEVSFETMQVLPCNVNQFPKGFQSLGFCMVHEIFNELVEKQGDKPG